MRISCVALTALGMIPTVGLKAQDKPNVVFLMAEDLSRESFAMYNGHGAQTPVLEEMARHGVTFTKAYSCAPVSSAARSTLITGCYAPSYALSWHRKMHQVTLPDEIHLFPYYLRQAGYHTSNAAKTDYNCVMQDDAWDIEKGKIGDWRKRPTPQTPFFHCLTVTTCHESSLHFPESDITTVETRHNPDDVVLFPQHPDTPAFRYTYARHYDAIYKVDQTLGKLLGMLKEDGLLDNTFVFYFGDNGGCLPGTKGYTTDLGLCVPMVLYIPEKFKNLAQFSYGSQCTSVISFLDLPPTLLSLAGVEIPSYMDGHPFLGKDVTAQDVMELDETFCYGDRFDELYASNRVVRKMDFKYSRNFLPYHPKSLHGYYRMYQAAFREWYKLYEEGKLNDVQSAFFKPQGPEELYLLSEDVYETKNLVGNPDFAQMLDEMRRRLDNKMIEEMDLGIIPEPFWVDECDDIIAFKKRIAPRYKDYLEAANLVRYDYRTVSKKICRLLSSKDEILQYWGLVSCCYYADEALPLRRKVEKLLKKGSPLVSCKAAVFLARTTGYNPTQKFNALLDVVRNEAEAVTILNDVAYVASEYPEYAVKITERESLKTDLPTRRLTFINSL